jgi:hypothetical protein
MSNALRMVLSVPKGALLKAEAQEEKKAREKKRKKKTAWALKNETWDNAARLCPDVVLVCGTLQTTLPVIRTCASVI